MAADGQIDIDGYFARIGLDPPSRPSLEALNAIAAAHVSSMPFNNLGILRGHSIGLDVASLNRKLIAQGLGGYCFEQNAVLEHVLNALGYAVTPLGARVRLDTPRAVIPPRTHFFLRVDLDGAAWLVDAGFGALSLASAIRLEHDIEQATPHESRRIVEEDGRLHHQFLRAGEWCDAYEFTLDPMHPIDRELANWWTSTCPASRFRRRMIVARAVPGATRLTIDNDKFTIRGADGVGDSRTIGSSAELLAILARHFGLAFPDDTHFDIPEFSWPASR